MKFIKSFLNCILIFNITGSLIYRTTSLITHQYCDLALHLAFSVFVALERLFINDFYCDFKSRLFVIAKLHFAVGSAAIIR